MKRWWLASLAVMFLVAPRPGIAAEPGDDPPFAVWGEFIYTVLGREKFVWTVTPSIRTDEQEINGNVVTRFSTEAIVALPKKEWELRSRLFIIGRAKEDGGAAFDQRIQIPGSISVGPFLEGADRGGRWNALRTPFSGR